MSFPVPNAILNELKHSDFSKTQSLYSFTGKDPDREVKIDLSKLSDDAVYELAAAFEQADIMKNVRMLNSILDSRSGKKDQTVRGLESLPDLLKSYLEVEQINKWIFRREKDGQLYPYLVTSIQMCANDSFRQKDKEEQFVIMRLVSYSICDDGKMGTKSETISFHRHHVSNRRISKILSDFDLFKETKELIAEHEAQVERYREIIMPGFSQQFVATGQTVRIGYSGKDTFLNKTRVIHDLSSRDFGAYNDTMDAETKTNHNESFPCPMHPMVKVFDLESHDFHWINGNMVEPYVYKNLLNHLVLPETHHDLLEMLTDDLTDFSNDFVEGKAAGNLIICKGPPGVGKTLTGELYSEHKKVPLIVLRAGKLGTTVAEVTKGMKQYLEWATRWNCPILVNECDIYIAKRSDNINLNAIVAEMLQLVEYYPGLLFMTTNRPDDIDDAFVSRALAIINYAAPEGKLVDESWRQIASLHGLKMDDTMIVSLKQLFPSIVQRDMKMLLKLAMKRSKRSGEPITPDLLRKMAMFRDIKMSAMELGTPDSQ